MSTRKENDNEEEKEEIKQAASSTGAPLQVRPSNSM